MYSKNITYDLIVICFVSDVRIPNKLHGTCLVKNRRLEWHSLLFGPFKVPYHNTLARFDKIWCVHDMNLVIRSCLKSIDEAMSTL